MNERDLAVASEVPYMSHTTFFRWNEGYDQGDPLSQRFARFLYLSARYADEQVLAAHLISEIEEMEAELEALRARPRQAHCGC